MSVITSVLPGWFDTALTALKQQDINGWMAIYAENAVHQFPFAPPGMPDQLQGKAAIQAYMQQLPQFLTFGSLTDIRVRETDNELIAEATGHHSRVSDGQPVVIHYVWFITLQHGKVTHFRDYMNPLDLAAL